MATPSLSAIFNFVKKYPITLCGFSLLFMPSVHRLLLYFTPLLLSTAIFIVAMMSWGPTASSEKRTTRRGKPKLVSERPEWTFHETMGMEEEEEEEGVEDDEEEAITQTEPHLGSKPRGALGLVPDLRKEDGSLQGTTCEGEPDPDLSKEDGSLQGTTCEGEPDPDLAKEGGAGPGTAASGFNFLAERRELDSGRREESSGAGTAVDRHAEPDPDLLGDGVGTAAHKDGAHLHAAREPEESGGPGTAADRHAEQSVRRAANKDGAGEHVKRDGDGHEELGHAHDKSHDAHVYADSQGGPAPHVMCHTRDRKHEQEPDPAAKKLPNYLQVCA